MIAIRGDCKIELNWIVNEYEQISTAVENVKFLGAKIGLQQFIGTYYVEHFEAI